MPTVNVVPRDNVSFERMEELASGYGWQLDQGSVIAARNADASPEWVWAAGGGTVTLMQDSTLKRPFIKVEADDPQPLVDRIEGDVPSYPLSEIVEIVTSAESPDDRIAALRLLAAAAPARADDTILQAIRDNAGQPHPRVRLAAVTASSRLRWSVLRPIVEQISEADENDALRGGTTSILNLTDWNRG